MNDASVASAPAEIEGSNWLARLGTSAVGLFPGLSLALAIAAFARVVNAVNGLVPDVVVALLLGAIVANALPVPAPCYSGVKFAQRYLLRGAIVVLGVSLSFTAILGTGGRALLVIIACVITALVLCALGAKLAGLSRRIGMLLGAGTAICGATAILTIGPLVAATELEIGYAVSTIFAYNILAIVFYPGLGEALNLSALAFGTWAGTSVNDTSAVVATGYIFGDAAGQTATIVKLTRTVLLAPLAVLVGVAYARKQDKGTAARTNIFKLVPWFVLGFLAMAMLNAMEAVPRVAAEVLAEAAKFLYRNRHGGRRPRDQPGPNAKDGPQAIAYGAGRRGADERIQSGTNSDHRS